MFLLYLKVMQRKQGSLEQGCSMSWLNNIRCDLAVPSVTRKNARAKSVAPPLLNVIVKEMTEPVAVGGLT